MKILNKLVIKNLKLNKWRTIVTIMGIIMSTALICAVGNLLTSLRQSLMESIINDSGYYHLMLKTSKNDLETLNLNRDIRDIINVHDIGYAILPNSQNQYKPYMHLYSLSLVTFKNLRFNLVEGKFPSNENEIVISKSIISNGGVNYKIGDEIILSLGHREYEGITVSGRYKWDEEENIKEKFVQEKTKKVTVVGIMERPNLQFESYQEAGYTILTTNMDSPNCVTYVTLKNPYNYKTDISEILGLSSIYHDASKSHYKDFYINSRLLQYEVLSFSENTMVTIMMILSIVVIIIIVTSVFCIRNSFNISITEKTKLFGMLSSIGATKKQIKKTVLLEGFYLALIGIPLGILSGSLASFILAKVLDNLIGSFLFNNGSGFVFKMSPIIIILSMLLSSVTIYFSVIKASRRASKINPIEAIRNNNEIKINSKKLKCPSIINKVFKTSGVVAYKNLARSRKKYRTTVISIVVSITTFLTMSSFVYYGNSYTKTFYNDYRYDIMVNISKSLEDPSLITSLDNIEYANSIFRSRNSYVLDDAYLSSFGKKIMDGETINIRFVGLNDADFKRYVESLNLNYNKMRDKIILNDQHASYDDDGKMTMKRLYEYKKGDSITLNNIKMTIGSVTESSPIGINYLEYTGLFVINKDYYNELDYKLESIAIKSSNSEQLEQDINNLGLHVVVDNVSKRAKEEKSMILTYSIFLYGFITVITLIGITNIFNTITSNIKLRQKEFAIFKSIGMTKKEFNRMINLETLFYSAKSLFYGIILGTIGSYLIYKAFSNSYDYGFILPVKEILISSIVVCILIFTIMHYSISKINKQNIIETIRNENI